jgi:F0F1-type ATP synthase assembly protein I
MIGLLGFIVGTIIGLIFGVLIVIAALQSISEK